MHASWCIFPKFYVVLWQYLINILQRKHRVTRKACRKFKNWNKRFEIRSVKTKLALLFSSTSIERNVCLFLFLNVWLKHMAFIAGIAPDT